MNLDEAWAKVESDLNNLLTLEVHHVPLEETKTEESRSERCGNARSVQREYNPGRTEVTKIKG